MTLSASLSAEEVVRLLGLARHPEGGYFRETYRHAPPGGGRGFMTAIYFLLPKGVRSAWHRVDAEEIWHFYAGAPLRLDIAAEGEKAATVHLGPDLAKDQRPQAMVPAHAWQSAESEGDWTLVGCTVAPAFDFAGFEMARPGWSPPR